MGNCTAKKAKSTKVCIGSLSSKITIQTRSIVAPTSGDGDFSEEFVDLISVWALVETSSGRAMFDGTDTERVQTHKFTVRYFPDLTAENWIKYNGKRYDIISTENLEEQNRFITFYCNVRGTVDNDSNVI